MLASGLQLIEMVRDEYKVNNDTQNFTNTYGTWKTSINYMEGGLCATFIPWFRSVLLDLNRQPEFEKLGGGKVVFSYIHR